MAYTLERGRNNGNGNWRPSTLLVRGGLKRSQFQETSEAIFATSGYIYRDAEEAELAFKGEKPCYIYSRFSNPTESSHRVRCSARACSS